MLSLLTIMTYTKLQSFLDHAGVRIEYERFMQKNERESINKLEERKYINSKLKKDTENKDAKEEKERAEAKLSLRSILRAPPEDEKPEAKALRETRNGQITPLLARLMRELYGKLPFYKDVEKTHPNLAEDIISEMIETISKSPCKLKFSNVNDLGNIPLKTPKLREVFYKMLKGEEASWTYDEHGEKVLVGKCYPPLTNFVSVSDATKIRVWLAQPALIRAIFRYPDEILSRRAELYRYVKDDTYTKEGATEDMLIFKSGTATDVDLNLLDFTASKTRPPGIKD
jgi:hypothetical protein